MTLSQVIPVLVLLNVVTVIHCSTAWTKRSQQLLSQNPSATSRVSRHSLDKPDEHVLSKTAQPAERDARYIFPINTGRSGSKYLSVLLGSCEDVWAEHEPGPGGGAMNLQHLTLESTYEKRKTIKIKDIDRIMRRHSTKSVYAETNPNFKTWFWDVTLDTFGAEQGKRIDVLVVRKYLPAVLLSIYELGWYSTPVKGNGWLPTANGVNSMIKPLDADRALTPFERIISSLINAEAVAQQIVWRYGNPESPHYLPNVHFHHYRSEELFDKQKVIHILEHDLHLKPTSETFSLAGQEIDKFRNERGMGALKPQARKKQTTLEEC